VAPAVGFFSAMSFSFVVITVFWPKSLYLSEPYFCLTGSDTLHCLAKSLC
jgi:hypothetical protein